MIGQLHPAITLARLVSLQILHQANGAGRSRRSQGAVVLEPSELTFARAGAPHPDGRDAGRLLAGFTVNNDLSTRALTLAAAASGRASGPPECRQ